MRFAACVLLVSLATVAEQKSPPPRELPAVATAQLAASLASATSAGRHIWRDTPATNADGTVNAYVEIPRGEKRKFEFDMRANQRAVDRVMPDTMGGYPINYGFVPQTVSYDGDPFDALVLGPPLTGGTIVRGVIVGLMYMEDEKGLDSKVVLSPLNDDGTPRYALTDADEQRVADYFRRYKLHEPGKFSKVPGWGSVSDGLAHVTIAHAFFKQCARVKGVCRLSD